MMFRVAVIASSLLFGGCASSFTETYEFSTPPISAVEIHDDEVVIIFNQSPAQWRRIPMEEKLAMPSFLGIDKVLGCGTDARPLILTVDEELDVARSQLDSTGETTEYSRRFDIDSEHFFPVVFSSVGQGDEMTVTYRCQSDSASIGSVHDDDANEEARVLAAVNEVVSGINENDLERKLSASRVDGTNFILQEAEDGTHTIRAFPRSYFFDPDRRPTKALHERIWNTRVTVVGPMAVVFADYDFYVDGELSHCGVNVYNLVNDEDTWKVANMSYTSKRSGCEPSPLGPFID